MPEQDANELFWIGVPRQVEKVKVLLHGPSGSGKSWLASTFPKPVFIDFEGGMSGIKHSVGRIPKDPKRNMDNWEEFRQTITILKKGNHPFETIVLDSANEMLAILIEHVVRTYSGVMKRNYSDVAAMADYQKINQDFKRSVRAILALPYHIVFTCASKDRDKDTDLVEPLLSGSLRKDIVKFFDMVGYTLVKDEDGKRVHAVSFNYRPEYVTKNRYSGFPALVPSDWAEISRYIYEAENGKENGKES